MSWTYVNEETEALYKEYLAEAEKLMAAFDAAADRTAWAEAINAELKADTEKTHILNKMTTPDGDDNFAVSYNDFHTSMYGAG